jgi:hypothetical protein
MESYWSSTSLAEELGNWSIPIQKRPANRRGSPPKHSLSEVIGGGAAFAATRVLRQPLNGTTL